MCPGNELLAEGNRTDYPAGTIIYREGAAPRAELVVEGLLRVYLTRTAGSGAKLGVGWVVSVSRVGVNQCPLAHQGFACSTGPSLDTPNGSRSAQVGHSSAAGSR